MTFLTLFHFLIRVLTFNHLKPFRTYLVGRNGAIWKTCFSPPQNTKEENQMKHKNELRNRLFIYCFFRVWRIMLLITGWAHKRQRFTLIRIIIMRIWKFLFTIKWVFQHKEDVSNLHVCSNGLRKIWASYIFHLSTRILTSTH